MEYPRFYVGADVDVAAGAIISTTSGSKDMPEDARITGIFRQCPPPFNAQLPESAASHLRVLRLNAGDLITLFDGLGGEFTATISEIAKKTVTVSVLSHAAIERESPLNITIAQALAVGDKMDWVVQKACELGAQQITPVAAERCTVRLSGDRATKKVAHYQAICVATAEQCGRNKIAQINPIATLEKLFAKATQATQTAQASQTKAATHYLICAPHLDQAISLTTAARAALETSGAQASITILIGPEGGFSPTEIALCVRHGAVAVSLGPRVLRTETAAAAALAMLGATFGDLA